MNLEDFLYRDISFAIERGLPHFIRNWVPPFKAIQVWNIVNQITSGVEFIHKHEEVHRDLKPSNGMLFLLARLIGSSPFLPQGFDVEVSRLRPYLGGYP